jgi:hypothetical protein
MTSTCHDAGFNKVMGFDVGDHRRSAGRVCGGSGAVLGLDSQSRAVGRLSILAGVVDGHIPRAIKTSCNRPADIVERQWTSDRRNWASLTARWRP